jgi:magnesium transporter
VIRLLRLRARRAPGLIEDAKEVLLKLFDADAEYSADSLENVYDALERASKLVLSGDLTDDIASEVLAEIARQEDLNGRIRRNMMDTRRAVSFLMRSKMLDAEQFEEARQILRDLDSLDSHTTFLFDKVNFLMDATVGFININQNKIIKLFSVASVALLPPTLIASVYGMNFRLMPELEWQYGYAYAIALMVASALAPMWYFRKRGWLK